MPTRGHNKMQFASEGFDISADDDNNVVLEVGPDGVVTKTVVHDEESSSPPTSPKQSPVVDDVLAAAREFKQQGNTAFSAHNYEEAVACYTRAIDAVPGMTADELLALRDAHEQTMAADRRAAFARQEEARRRKQQQNKNNPEKTTNEAEPDDVEKDNEDVPAQQQPAFQAPHHTYGTELAVFHHNRATTYYHLQAYETALPDCHVAILWNPGYTKAYLRRAAVYEHNSDTEHALADAQHALQLENVPGTRKLVARLQKLEDARIERLKTETMDKLKELGNSILGNFGLSLDNFNAVQDPNTGSYSISFNNNNENKE